MQIGNCRLCQQTKELQDSHFLPAALYKLLRDAQQSGRSAIPVFVTKQKALHSSRQIHTYLLCADCEDLFNKNGEAWVLANCYREGAGFELQNTLKNSTPVATLPSTRERVFAGSCIGPGNVDKLAYFAASVIWRGSVQEWWHEGHELTLPQLGYKYNEQFRTYLLGQTAFPTDAVLVITVSDQSPPINLCIPPYGGRFEECHRYRFPIPGIVFALMVGKQIPQNIRAICAVRSPQQLIFLGSSFDERIVQDFLPLVATAKPGPGL